MIGMVTLLPTMHDQTQAQNEIIEQQRSRVRELETSVRQLEGRCSDLREAAAGHEQRTKDAQAEVVKGNSIIEKLMVRCFCSLVIFTHCHMDAGYGLVIFS
jgi:uncharacterized protein YoxC